jgi:hypothetical protein
MENKLKKPLATVKLKLWQSSAFRKGERTHHPLSLLRNAKTCQSLNFAAAKGFFNLFSINYYFPNSSKITLVGAKFWTLSCEGNTVYGGWQHVDF